MRTPVSFLLRGFVFQQVWAHRWNPVHNVVARLSRNRTRCKHRGRIGQRRDAGSCRPDAFRERGEQSRVRSAQIRAGWMTPVGTAVNQAGLDKPCQLVQAHQVRLRALTTGSCLTPPDPARTRRQLAGPEAG